MIGKWTAGLVALALMAVSAPAMAQITEASVTGGKIAGTAVDNLGEFKGIPFAAPPVGDLRWRAPGPAAPWTGVRDATKFSPACMQPESERSGITRSTMSEDCLYLNVWTPAHSPHEICRCSSGSTAADISTDRPRCPCIRVTGSPTKA